MFLQCLRYIFLHYRVSAVLSSRAYHGNDLLATNIQPYPLYHITFFVSVTISYSIDAPLSLTVLWKGNNTHKRILL